MEITGEKKRNYRVDNIKALLIFLVVLGHNMEPFYEGSIRVVYLFIYLFHMPLFVLCSGYFAKHSVGRIKYNLLYPYVLFQILYLVFELFYYKESDYPISLLTPYWTLWYLFSLIFWTASLPFLKKYFKQKKRTVKIMIVFFLFGILAGFDETIGMQFGISRTIVFFPFFLVGYAMHTYIEWDWMEKKYTRRIKYKMAVLWVLVFLLYWILHSNLRPKTVFGAYSYLDCDSSWLIRLFLYFVGMLLCLCVIVWMPKRKLVFSYLGQNSMQIFLLHGFLIKIFRKIEIYEKIEGEGWRWLFLIFTTSAFVLVLGSKPVKKCMTPFMRHPLAAKRAKRRG